LLEIAIVSLQTLHSAKFSGQHIQHVAVERNARNQDGDATGSKRNNAGPNVGTVPDYGLRDKIAPAHVC